MNRLIIMLAMIMAMVIAAPVVWAGEDYVRTDREVSYQNLSPAEFFGYTNADAVSGSDRSDRENEVRVGDEQGVDMMTNTETGNRDLSPEAFFGYTNPNSATATALTDIKGPVEETAVIRCCGIEDLKRSGPVDDILSPAVFFYDYPLPNTNMNPCTLC